MARLICRLVDRPNDAILPCACLCACRWLTHVVRLAALLCLLLIDCSADSGRRAISNALANEGLTGYILDQDTNGYYGLDLSRGQVGDLAFLSHLPISRLELYQTPVYDLSPLEKLPLRWLAINRTLVQDVTPLAGTSLKELHVDRDMILRGMDALRHQGKIEKINGHDADDFW